MIWLKFDSSSPEMSTAGDYILTKRGDPKHMPPERGIFRNWGCFFDFGDLIEVPNLKYEVDCFSVTFWMVLPVKYNTEAKHTLLASKKSSILAIDWVKSIIKKDHKSKEGIYP